MSEPSPHASLLGKIADYTVALANDPASTAFVQLADAYRQMGLLEDALLVARTGVQKNPQYPLGFSILGTILVQNGNLEEAARVFEQSLALNPLELNALKGLARLRWKQGQQEASAHLLRKILSVKPGDSFATEMLSQLKGSGREGRPGAAAGGLSSGGPTPEVPLPTRQTRSQAEPISTATIAEIYIRQGYLRRAMRVYRDILHVYPHNQDVRAKLIDLKRQVEARENNDDLHRTAERTDGALSPMSVDMPADVSAAPVENPAPATTDPGGSQKQLDQFQGWLKAIEKRRGHVS